MATLVTRGPPPGRSYCPLLPQCVLLGRCMLEGRVSFCQSGLSLYVTWVIQCSECICFYSLPDSITSQQEGFFVLFF